MQKLGFTRSAWRPDHLLHTPDTFVRAPRPGMTKATAVVHVAPAAGARFTQYTAEFEPGGVLGPAGGQRFLYVLEGALRIDGRDLAAGAYSYLPEGCDVQVTAASAGRASVIEKPYSPRAGLNPPAWITADERDVPAKPLNDDPGLLVRQLLPDDPSFDFAVNTMVYQPGSALSMVEIHVMEHGLVMLEGGGIYRLGESWYPVSAGDFFWMAPYCPQWFGAIGKVPAKYLIYKDWNR
jgi:(S)-ureidoglycine aminohydrolase